MKSWFLFIIGIITLYFIGSSFMRFVYDIYLVLDGYIWSFPAGLIAFFVSVFIVGLMIQFTLLILTFILVFVGTIFEK